jgi:hypothetical protein
VGVWHQGGGRVAARSSGVEQLPGGVVQRRKDSSVYS